MALSPGTRLGHYDVTALLGEGGMGQVWQATDTQLNRQVALKILPDAFAADSDRLARVRPTTSQLPRRIHSEACCFMASAVRFSRSAQADFGHRFN